MRSFVETTPLGGSARASFSPPCPDYVEDVVLAADTLARVAIPAGARFVVFSFDGDFRSKPGVVTTTLALPAATTSDGSGSELNPAARRIPETIKVGAADVAPTHLCLRAASACAGSLSFYG